MNKRQKMRKIILLTFFFLFPAIYYYFSPYLAVMSSSVGILSGSLIIFIGLFFSSLFFGRAFCGWVCPAGMAQELVMQINTKRVKKGNFLKWIIWVPWSSFIIALIVRHGGFHKIAPFYQTTFGFSINDVYSLITYLFVLLVIVLPAFIIGKRAFCHHICWMAPFMIIGRKISLILKISKLRLGSYPKKCVHCHLCTENCPMSLDVEDMVAKRRLENTECILCATCVDNCKTNTIVLY